MTDFLSSIVKGRSIMSDLNEKFAEAWKGFSEGEWQNNVNVRDFIQKTILHMKATNLS